jgi:hypothetical protein
MATVLGPLKQHNPVNQLCHEGQDVLMSECALSTVKLQTNLLCWHKAIEDKGSCSQSLSQEHGCGCANKVLCVHVCDRYACLQSRQELFKWATHALPPRLPLQ